MPSSRQYFGPLSLFHYTRHDPVANPRKGGYVVAQFADASRNEAIIASLNGVTVADRAITVRHATAEQQRTAAADAAAAALQPHPQEMAEVEEPSEAGVTAAVAAASALAAFGAPTRFLRLRGMAARDELSAGDCAAARELAEETADECERFGEVLAVRVAADADVGVEFAAAGGGGGGGPPRGGGSRERASAEGEALCPRFSRLLRASALSCFVRAARAQKGALPTACPEATYIVSQPGAKAGAPSSSASAGSKQKAASRITHVRTSFCGSLPYLAQ
mmetsp:Transcript_24642/g.80549  ORF Transcript_24642/g.80549 Transcript_24642/m.80549 type:complete len:278 (-) Transcript_24642:807-1640(-)